MKRAFLARFACVRAVLRARPRPAEDHERNQGNARQLEEPCSPPGTEVPERRRAAEAVQGRVEEAPAARSPTTCCARKAPSAPAPARSNARSAPGVFVCAGCGLPLFTSEMKFESRHRLAVVLHLHPGRVPDQDRLQDHLPAHRVPLHALRRPPRPRVRRRPAADRQALLQQRRGAEVHSEGREGLSLRSSASGVAGKWKRTGPSGSALTNCFR